MKLKLDADGKVVVQDGKPVYVKDDGTEVAFDAAGTTATITRLNGEAMGHRQRAEAAEGKLKTFEGITDPAAALKAMTTVAGLSDKQLIDAGQADQIKIEAIRAVEEKYAPVVAERDSLRGELTNEKLGGAFSRSPVIVGEKAKVALPPDMIQAKFGHQFKLEDNKIVAYDANGQKIYSDSNPGELASFDEALGKVIDAYPFKEQILKGNVGTGGGSQNPGGGSGGGKSMSRKEFDGLGPAEKQAAIGAKVAIYD